MWKTPSATVGVDEFGGDVRLRGLGGSAVRMPAQMVASSTAASAASLIRPYSVL